ncbi:ABC transporter substrate-binding protein [Halobacteriales archaeon QS_1_68_17]|nr:MAG: ABC transporter substrate-binding protein [Halobacteriales archaeon QS_1_68_17]
MFEWFDRRFPTQLVARRNLSRTKVRSALACLGIVIGVIAIASLGMFGAALRTQATQNLGEIGNQVVISPDRSEGVESLTGRDVRTIERAADGQTVLPVKSNVSTITVGRQQSRVQLYGMERPAQTYAARVGTIPDPLRSGALVGSSLAEDLDIGVGSTIEVDGNTYRVRAVLEEGDAFNPVSPDSAVILPERAIPESGYDNVIVVAETGEAANATAQAVRDSLNDREPRVTVFELSSITDQISQFFTVLNQFLIGIGSISLLVAGVSILNVMLMSTVERREEIGVMRAVGYQKRQILKIMLAEAILLGVVGGIAGALISLGAGMIIHQVLLDNALLAFRPEVLVYLPVALGFGVATSAISGLYPAWKAANERPVEALRN